MEDLAALTLYAFVSEHPDAGRIVTVRKPSLPDAEESRVYQILGIDWKRACPAVKSELKGKATLYCLCEVGPGFIGAPRR